ncbi:spore coat protein [Bacillus sp. FSL W7-1360]
MFCKKPQHCCPPPRPVCKPVCSAPVAPMQCGKGPASPVQSKQMPAVVHPTKHQVVESTQEYIVPEVHPTHTTHIKNHVYKHIHQYPQTQSVEENVTSEQYCEQPAPSYGAPSYPVAPSAYAPSNVMPAANVPAPSNVMPTANAPANVQPATKPAAKPAANMPANVQPAAKPATKPAAKRPYWG